MRRVGSEEYKLPRLAVDSPAGDRTHQLRCEDMAMLRLGSTSSGSFGRLGLAGSASLGQLGSAGSVSIGLADASERDASRAQPPSPASEEGVAPTAMRVVNSEFEGAAPAAMVRARLLRGPPGPRLELPRMKSSPRPLRARVFIFTSSFSQVQACARYPCACTARSQRFDRPVPPQVEACGRCRRRPCTCTALSRQDELVEFFLQTAAEFLASDDALA